MLQLHPSIEDGHVVLHLQGELDFEGVATVTRLIGQSMGETLLDFTDAQALDDAGFTLISRAVRRCPYHLEVRGLRHR